MKRFGTSYFWATLLLPAKIQEATVELYKFVRIPDEIVDQVHKPQLVIYDQSEQLQALYEDWQEAYEFQDVDHPVFGQWIRIMQDNMIDIWLVSSFYEAMRDDLTVSRYDSYEQLQSYMYGSAEVVGLMMCSIIWYDISCADITLSWACKLGEAMQLTNFLRDVDEDCVDLDRIYMPSDDLARFDLTHNDIVQFCQTKKIDERRVAYMKHMIVRCDALYQQADNSIQYLNPSCQSAIQLSSDLYRSILRKIESIEYNQFEYSARTTKRDKFVVIAKQQLLCKLTRISLFGKWQKGCR